MIEGGIKRVTQKNQSIHSSVWGCFTGAKCHPANMDFFLRTPLYNNLLLLQPQTFQLSRFVPAFGKIFRTYSELLLLSFMRFFLDAPKLHIIYPKNMMGISPPKLRFVQGFFWKCSNPCDTSPWSQPPFIFSGGQLFGSFFHLHPTSKQNQDNRFHPPPPGGFGRIDLGGAEDWVKCMSFFLREKTKTQNKACFVSAGTVRGGHSWGIGEYYWSQFYSIQYSLPVIPCEGQYLLVFKISDTYLIYVVKNIIHSIYL